MSVRLFTPTPPNLPLAPQEYEATYQDKFSNTLRLFFNQLKTAFSAVLGTCGVMHLNAPYGVFIDLTTQSAAVANTAYPVLLGTAGTVNGISIVGGSAVTVTYAGFYNFQFSLQLTKTGGASLEFVYIWARVDGVNTPSSATRVAIQGAGSDTVAAWNFVLQMAAGSNFQLMWSVTDTRIQIEYLAAAAPAPAIPSVILTATYVSNIPV